MQRELLEADAHARAEDRAGGLPWWHDGTTTTAVASGCVLTLVNLTLTFSLALVVWDPLPQFANIAVDASNLGCGLACFVLATKTTCPLYVSCPNAVAAVVFAGVVSKLVEAQKESGAAPEQVVPTVLAAISACTLMTGALFYGLGRSPCPRVLPVPPVPLVEVRACETRTLASGSTGLEDVPSPSPPRPFASSAGGRYHLTRLMQVFPQAVASGFLACIGAGLVKYLPPRPRSIFKILHVLRFFSRI